MDTNLHLMQLKELRRLATEAIKEEKEEGHGKLIELLKREYKATAKEIEQVMEIIQEKKPKRSSKQLKELNKQIHNYLELLGLRPRNHDPENPNYQRLKQLANNNITKMNKILKSSEGEQDSQG